MARRAAQMTTPTEAQTKAPTKAKPKPAAKKTAVKAKPVKKAAALKSAKQNPLPRRVAAPARKGKTAKKRR
jgi:hypothetical protein